MIKTKERVKNFGEVFTNNKEVTAMLNLIPEEQFKNVFSTWLEPACGNGNFIIEIIKRKLAYYNEKEGLEDIYALKILTNIYGFDIQQDNIEECIENITMLLKQVVKTERQEIFLKLAREILYDNIQCADFLKDKIIISKYQWNDKNIYSVSLQPLM